MGTCDGIKQSANDRLVLLKKEQEKYHEGSLDWIDIQSKVDQIIAQNYLEYVNR